MQNILNIAQIVLAGLLVTVILLQNQGAGLSTALGGDGNVYRTKRGFEKSLFVVTIVISILFFGVAVANILIRQ
ncbi:MAG: preprotein translocase subunit SecG [Patescibacteria group bacterium]|jgi:preprotein translocase subunit SecG